MRVAGAIVSLIALVASAGCLNTTFTGIHYNAAASVGSSTGSAASSGTAIGASTGGSTTGAALVTSSAASSTGSSTGIGATTGSTTGAGTTQPDAGVCQDTASNLELAKVYLPQGSVEGWGSSNSADFDGDGRLDLIVSGGGQTGFNLMFGTADGGLRQGGFFPASNSAEEGVIATGDVNGDGWPDALYADDNGGIAALINQGNGQLVQWPNPVVTIRSIYMLGLAVADLNGDGVADIVDAEYDPWGDAGFSVNAYFGLRDGGFESGAAILTSWFAGQSGVISPASLIVADLNQDGLLDVALAPAGVTDLAVGIQASDGGFSSQDYSFPYPIEAAVLPRSGAAPDLVVVYPNSLGNDGFAQILWNAGDGSFLEGPTFEVPHFGGELQVGDFNGDCLADLASSGDGCGPQMGVTILYGDLDGGFAPAQGLQSDAVFGMTILGPVGSPSELAGAVVCSGPGEGALRIYGDPTGP